jgi:hypothetical protein
MIRVVLKLAVAAAAIWAVWSFVPVGGRTCAQRWRSAGNLATFLERGWAEATGAAAPRPAPRPQARQKPSPVQPRPTEGHTEADRRAVERILAERLRGSE